MKRLWGVRHIRYLIAAWCFWIWWEDIGRVFWMTPNPSDLEYLDKIWRGEA